MTELGVPLDAYDAWVRYTYRARKHDESEDDSIRAVATPVVAAELRRLAREGGNLLDRADELEAGAR